MRIGDKIEVWWEDHHERNGQVEPLGDNLKPFIWISTGYLVSVTPTMIEIARDVAPYEEVNQIGAPLAVIRKCIVKSIPDLTKYTEKKR